jgi:ABC-type multidrug transport system fused ATPase/permease subunit
MTPKITAPRRRMPLARLGLLTAAEAGLLALGGVAIRGLIDAMSAGQSALAPCVALAGVALLGSAAAWFRAVQAEDVSMSYANDLRGMLMEHAVASHASRRRLGLLAVRLTGDVTPMREWVATGLADTGSALASILAGVFVLWLAASWMGVGVGASLVCALALVLWLAKGPLEARMRELRTERGRVSAMAGDVVLSAATIARYDAIAREKRRFDERANNLRDAAVKRRRLAALLEVPGGLTLALVAIIVVASQGAVGVLDWALLFFAAALLATAFRTAGRAMDSYVAYAVAEARMQVLAEQIETASSRPRRRKPEESAAFFIGFVGDQAVELDRGDVVLVRASDVMEGVDAVAQNALRSGGALLEGAAVAGLKDKVLGRRVALVSPTLPLMRASVRRNLSLGRRDASEDGLRAALDAVGLAGAAWDLERRLDPAIDDPDFKAQTLLRLARALSHQAEVIVVAEPLLYHAPEAPALLRAIAKHANAGVLAACAAPPLAGQRAFDAGELSALASAS